MTGFVVFGPASKPYPIDLHPAIRCIKPYLKPSKAHFIRRSPQHIANPHAISISINSTRLFSPFYKLILAAMESYSAREQAILKNANRPSMRHSIVSICIDCYELLQRHLEPLKCLSAHAKAISTTTSTIVSQLALSALSCSVGIQRYELLQRSSDGGV